MRSKLAACEQRASRTAPPETKPGASCGGAQVGLTTRTAGSLVLGAYVTVTLLQGCSHRESHPSQALASTTAATVTGSDAQGGTISRTPKDEATDLMNMLLPFAEKMLREHGEFYPYGGAMLPDGSMKMLGATDGNEHPNSKDIIDLMVTAFREEARQRKYKATAIVYDVTTLPPGAAEKSDAIAVRLDHEGGYSVVVMIPYHVADGQLVEGTLFTVKGDGSIFPTQ
jgi:hypothetical protein